MKKILIIFLLYSLSTFACRPASNLVTPTLEENVKKASHIFVGTLIASKEVGKNKDYNYEVEFQVQESLKGSSAKKVILKSFASSCNRFAQQIEIGFECIIFADKENNLLSSLFDGDASECNPAEKIGASRKSELLKKISDTKKLLNQK